MEVCSQKSCLGVGAGLSLRLPSLWASEPAVAACVHVYWVLEVHSMKCFAWEMYVHVLDSPALLSLSSVQLYWRVWWSWKKKPILDFCIGYVLLAVISENHPISGIHLMDH